MKKLLCCASALTILFASATVFAKTINLYSEPKVGSTVTGNVDTNSGITIIYTPKDSEWTKVGNPANGNVGWIKSSDLGNAGYNMRIITSGDGTHSYNVYQFGAGNTYSQEQFNKQLQLFEQQQQMMQKQMSHLFSDMFYFPQPIFVPVVVMQKSPVQQKSPTTGKLSTSETAKTAPATKH